ncbi:MAG: AzlD domain-containing protein [Ruminococcaceae bacterium]|nr:AzlD domain-containing protein [Oscillospiraceae bacterium]
MYFYICVAVMAVTTYLIRMLPLTLFRKKITNPFVNSFLYYVPCACLTAMTVPAIFFATGHIVSGAVGLVCAVILAFCGLKLPAVAAVSCTAVLICELCFLGVGI